MSAWLLVVQGAHKGRPCAMSFFVGVTPVVALHQHTPVRFIHQGRPSGRYRTRNDRYASTISAIDARWRRPSYFQVGRFCHGSKRRPNFRDFNNTMVLFPSSRERNVMVPQPALEPAKLLILVVDDDESVRDSLTNMMESEGFEVRAFANGHDLLGEASLPAIGCLVVDYHMPAMNGLELIGALRGRGISMPAILITSDSTSQVRNRATAISVLVVEKPRLGNYLLDCVRTAIAQHAQSLS